MVAGSSGVLGAAIADTPIAVVDLETTGLSPGQDRIVEIAIVRRDPGGPGRLVLDTLVNPLRPMAATEIHGITDRDVRDAPRFSDLAGDIGAALDGAVVAAYNVYFDIGFLTTELRHAGIDVSPPHFCLMYLRPMLGLGKRCKLSDACSSHGIGQGQAHMASADAASASQLLEVYMKVMRERGVATFDELARLKKYKFTASFGLPPLAKRGGLAAAPSSRLRSRGPIPVAAVNPADLALRSYWDSLEVVLADLDVEEQELTELTALRRKLGLGREQIRYLHARAFASAINRCIDDRWLDDSEVGRLQQLHAALSRLGWAPGQLM